MPRSTSRRLFVEAIAEACAGRDGDATEPLICPVPLSDARLARARLQPGLGARPAARAAARRPGRAVAAAAPARHAAPDRPAAGRARRQRARRLRRRAAPARRDRRPDGGAGRRRDDDRRHRGRDRAGAARRPARRGSRSGSWPARRGPPTASAPRTGGDVQHRPGRAGDPAQHRQRHPARRQHRRRAAPGRAARLLDGGPAAAPRRPRLSRVRRRPPACVLAGLPRRRRARTRPPVRLHHREAGAPSPTSPGSPATGWCSARRPRADAGGARGGARGAAGSACRCGPGSAASTSATPSRSPCSRPGGRTATPAAPERRARCRPRAIRPISRARSGRRAAAAARAPAPARAGRRAPAPPPRRSASRRRSAWARCSTIGALFTPSATWPSSARMRASARPSARRRPTLRLRDRSPVVVSTRSPRPERPMKVCGLGAEGDAEAGHLGQAAGHQRSAGVEAELHAVGDAGGDGEHVLDRAADLDPDRVGRGVDAQRAAVEGLDRGLAQAGVAARRDQRRRLAARHLDREARPREHADARVRRGRLGDLVAEPAGAFLKALAQPEHGRAVLAGEAAQHRVEPGHRRGDDDQAAAPMAHAPRRSRSSPAAPAAGRLSGR